MYDTIDFNAFNDWFLKHRPNNFSYDGRVALFDHLEELDDAVSENGSCLGIEFDPVAFCCEYSEYENIQEFWQDYDQKDYPTIEKIKDHTSVIELAKNSFIIQQF